MLERYSPSVCQRRLFSYGWDGERAAGSVRVEADGREVLLNPDFSNGTTAVQAWTCLRADVVSYWELSVLQGCLYGTSVMFGLGDGDMTLRSDRFANLMGQDGGSVGLSHHGELWYGGECVLRLTDSLGEAEHSKRGSNTTRVGVLYDGTSGYTGFYENGAYLGGCVVDIKGPVYPTASSTAANTRLELTDWRRSYANLTDRCVSKILDLTRGDGRLCQGKQIRSLPIPNKYMDYFHCVCIPTKYCTCI